MASLSTLAAGLPQRGQPSAEVQDQLVSRLSFHMSPENPLTFRLWCSLLYLLSPGPYLLGAFRLSFLHLASSSISPLRTETCHHPRMSPLLSSVSSHGTSEYTASTRKKRPRCPSPEGAWCQFPIWGLKPVTHTPGWNLTLASQGKAKNMTRLFSFKSVSSSPRMLSSLSSRF
jgi:hypothetical protein